MMKVLVAGTEADRTGLQKTVGDWGYQTVSAADGLEAWMLLQAKTEPMVLILDWLMPGMNGVDLCRKLKQSEDKKNLYVILVVNGGQDSIATGFDVGADDYLTMPFSPDELHSRLALGKRILDYQHSVEQLNRELLAKDHQLNQFAGHDRLTGVASRDLFAQRLAEEWRRAGRSGQPLSLIVLDIDFFKAYNQTYGQQVGDECLKIVANTICSSISRGGDFVARNDGAEFVVVLPNTDSLGALVIAEAIRVAVAIQNIEHPAGIRGHVTVSAGTATLIPELDTEAEAFVAKARQTLYLAKAAGRNAVRQAA
ncbi:MAG: diguanylate cyclase [Negativicutes bacterium]|nr:diguanylate cyclase [Negativicutes bacterium]